MRKQLFYFIVCAFFCACSALAAVRSPDATARVTDNANRNSTVVSSRVSDLSRSVSSRIGTTSRAGKTRIRSTPVGTTRTMTRAPQGATTPRGAITTALTNATRSGRLATNKTARAATANIATNTFNLEHSECQDAYFACMDQFCAQADDRYRRCACSAKLDVVKARERALDNASVQLQDFKNLNIESILKTPAEVKAMLSASEGELKLAKKRDTSASMKKLTAISDVLTNTRNNAMSTGGQLDIAGDIKQIWNTTDLISGVNIANLTGESLYNAVHAQCAELVANQCPSQSTLDMVVSAYGMYIENDCTIILATLDKQATNANAAIRETNREMMTARLENYDSHNSATINECVANVRADLTTDTACGTDFVHCLDITGLYLNKSNGTPIYSSKFYELESQVSLSGDILINSTNAKLIAELNRKKEFAKNTLETCRDLSDDVWNEFLRQAITEIYQGQQSKIRQVKNECMDVVNTCYDEKTKQLRDYSNLGEQILLGDRLELSEKICTEKLTTCSNLYGGGPGGLELLIAEMRNITNQKIAQNCLASLQDYAKKLCRVSSNDTLHDYPYGCRVYAPGNVLYATKPECTYINQPAFSSLVLPDYTNWQTATITPSFDSNLNDYMCPSNRKYTSCKANYYLSNDKCYECPEGWECPGGGAQAYPKTGTCGDDYIGSLYQKMVAYALEYCVRPSESEKEIPNEVLADVNVLMDSIKVDMATVLAAECERQDGTWTTVFENDENKNMNFYNLTNANLGWGLCRTNN